MASRLDPFFSARFSDADASEVEDWLEARNYRIKAESLLDGGHTSAIVARGLIWRDGDRLPKRVILKYEPSSSWSEDETRRAAEAIDDCPTAFAEHVVRLVDEPIILSSGATLLLNHVAGSSIDLIRPVEAVIATTDIYSYATAIVGSHLSDWNHHPDVAPRPLTEVVRDTLQWRLDRDGRLSTIARDLGFQLGDPSADWIQTSEGQVVPNALNWVSLARAEITITAFYGRVHNDFHPGNILVEAGPAASTADFWIIDLGQFRRSGPLLIDAADFLVASLTALAHDFRIDLSEACDALLGENPSTKSVGLTLLVQSVWNAIRENLDEPTLSDDVTRQWRLALILAVIKRISRQFLSTDERLELMALCGRLCLRWSGTLGIELGAPPTRGLELAGLVPSASSEDEFVQLCGGFKGDEMTILIVDAQALEALTYEVGLAPWTAVLGLIDIEGLDRDYREPCQQVTPWAHSIRDHETEAVVSAKSTVWYAAGSDDIDRKDWLVSRKPAAQSLLRAMARNSPRRCHIVTCGSDARIQTLTESAVEQFGSRCDVIDLVIAGVEPAASYLTDSTVETDRQGLRSRFRRILRRADVRTAPASIPGESGPVFLDSTDLAYFADAGELIHSNSGTSSAVGRELGEDFYRGADISWFEVSLHVEVDRAVRKKLHDQLIEDLASSASVRLSLRHAAGAGGTTVARSLAWSFAHLYPTYIVESAQTEIHVAERIRHLREMTGKSVLCVVERTTEAVLDRLFQRLKANNQSAVILTVERGPRPQTEGPRSRYLGFITKAAERSAFARAFEQFRPAKAGALAVLAVDDQRVTPFLFGLATFESDFQGLAAYVQSSLTNLNSEALSAVVQIALAHGYGGVALPYDVARSIDAESRLVEAREYLPDLLLSSQTDDGLVVVRTRHYLVAMEILKQALASSGSHAGEWKAQLSRVGIELLNVLRRIYEGDPPTAIEGILRQLLIDRSAMDHQERTPRSFSGLVVDVPTAAGRVALLRHAATSFPKLDYLWAHYGRLVSYDTGDYAIALEALNRALALPGSDTTSNYHMRAIVHRNHAQALLNEASTPSEVRAALPQVLDIYERAANDLIQSETSDSANEHPHVTMIQICQRVFHSVRRAEELDSYSAAVLADPWSQNTLIWLRRATEATEALDEIRGEREPSSYHANALTWFAQIHDDHPLLLQRLTNLLDRDDIVPNPIRRQLVATYCDRANGWTHLPATEVDKCLSLLEDNLLDDPADGSSVKYYLKIGRLSDRVIDRIADNVAVWARSNPPSRDALFYHFCLLVLQVLEGGRSLGAEAASVLRQLKSINAPAEHQNARLEWLGSGVGLRALVHHSEVKDWRRDEEPDGPSGVLRRLSGRIKRIKDPGSGWYVIDEAPDLEVHFVPQRAGAVRGRDEGKRISSLISFTPDGMKAWGPRLD